MPSVVRPTPILLAVLAVSGLVAQSPPPEPLPSELTESVEVRLVTVDIIALDEHDETVPDLTKADFELFVDGKLNAIDTLDTFCSAGAEADPKSFRLGAWPTPPDLTDATRRVVLAFDYLHLVPLARTAALQDYQWMLKEKAGIADEEMMVVALTGGIRVEQPFTKDRSEIVKALHRMEHDISLWNGNFSHLTEFPLFASLRALVAVLRVTPGPKAVVYVSEGWGPSNRYDDEFERLAAVASDARVSFYPVDLRGMYPTDRTGPAPGGPAPPAAAAELPGAPPGLWRLASMTGGRLTSNTNDFTIAYARARRDLGCRYTVGFYDHHPEADKQHRVEVNSRRKGVHLLYGARYTFPSEKQRRSQGLEAAFLVPQQFPGGGLRAHLFPLQPQDAKRWNAILVVDFPAVLNRSASDSTSQFGAVLRKESDVVHRFNRSMVVKSHGGTSSGVAPRVTFIEPVTLPPGNYSLTAVLAGAEDATPFGRVSDLTVPPLPKHEAILTGPILGRRRGDDVVVYGGGDAKGAAGDRLGARASFRPLLDDEVDRAEPLAALTHVCILRPKAEDGPWSVSRKLETGAGESAGSLADVTFNASARTKVQCERLLDELPVAQLKPGRYTFRAVLAAASGMVDAPIEALASFSVLEPTAPAPPAIPATSQEPPAPSR
jgi:VWFA-related protein